MVSLILLLFISRIDPSPKIIDTFDILEVNHTYNEWGGKGLVQVMGTEYVGEFNKMHEYYPRKNWKSGYWEIRIDSRIIRAKSFQETHTSYDREVEDRKPHSVALRRGLTKTKEQIKAENETMGYVEEIGDQFVGPILKVLRN
jgi:hypothetical protein